MEMSFLNFHIPAYKKESIRNIFSFFKNDLSSPPNTVISHFKNHLFYFSLFLAGWFAINLLQSIYTQIANDEAYYWMFSNQLDWGYFDHPPLIAMFIKLGGLLLDGETGVRIISMLTQIISLFIIWRIIDEKEITLRKLFIFFVVAASIPLFHVYGFIATPDSPFLLFTTLFLFAYQRFLKADSIFNVIYLAITMAGLMYSKYHGGLVIIITIMSNLKLLLNVRFWMAGITALTLFLPHIMWQYENGFPTFQYQMIGRVKSFGASNSLEYFLTQLIVFNPVILVLLIAAFRQPGKISIFGQTLKFLIAGFFIFFMVSSFFARVEPHWTAAASIPAIILIYKYFSVNLNKWARAFSLLSVTLGILLFVRLGLIFDLLPFHIEFIGQKEWAENIEEKTGSLPVAFVNSYQKASVYSFYSGKTGFSLNNIYYRKNQFDLWDYEEKYQGQVVAVFFEPKPAIQIDAVEGRVGNYVMVIDTLQSFQEIKIDFNPDAQKVYRKNEIVKLPVSITNPYPYPVQFDRPYSPVSFRAVFLNEGEWISKEASLDVTINSLLPGQTVQNILSFTIPDLPSGLHQFALSVRTPLLLEAYNSSIENIKIAP